MTAEPKEMPPVALPFIPGPRPTVDAERLHRKQRLAGAFRLFARYGFDQGIAGHITARDPEMLDHFWVNPFGQHFSTIRVSDLLLVNKSGEVVDGDRPVNRAAFAIHSALHEARPDVVAACHAHTTHGKAWSVLGKTLDPITQDACAFYQDHTLFDDYTGVVFDLDEGVRIAGALGPHKAVILKNHGHLTVGQSVEEAAWWFIAMDDTCRTQLLAQAAGICHHIPHAVAKATADLVGQPIAGLLAYNSLWETLAKTDPDFLE